MPSVRISSFPWTRKQREAVAREITASIVKHVGADPAVTWVVFEEIPQPQWYLAGREFKGSWSPGAKPKPRRRAR